MNKNYLTSCFNLQSKMNMGFMNLHVNDENMVVLVLASFYATYFTLTSVIKGNTSVSKLLWIYLVYRNKFNYNKKVWVPYTSVDRLLLLLLYMHVFRLLNFDASYTCAFCILIKYINIMISDKAPFLPRGSLHTNTLCWNWRFSSWTTICCRGSSTR